MDPAAALKTAAPPHSFLFDLIHYTGKLKPAPLQNGRWCLGATLKHHSLLTKLKTPDIADSIAGKQKKRRGNSARGRIAPSTARSLRDFTASDAYRTDLNLFTPDNTDRSDLAHEAWKRALGVITVTDYTDTPVTLPVSTVEHENSQLVWGRVSKSGVPIDTCCYGDECEALNIRATQGPLGRYLTPQEQTVFWETGRQPKSTPPFCLLCIRRDIQACFLAYSSIVVNPQRQLERPTFVIPPFTNLCNTPGGYKLEAMGVTPKSFMSLPVHICGVSGALCVHYDPQREVWFVDQGAYVAAYTL